VVGDFALELGPIGGYFADMVVRDDDLVADDGLRTAVFLSLFCDARAQEGDPVADGDRRGWWADELAEQPNDKIGSRRWLVTDRGKLRPDSARLLRQYDEEALQWLIDDGVAAAVDVTVVIEDASPGKMIRERVVIERPNVDPAEFEFAHVWEGEANAV
jgi:phage gp46-like protein